MFALLQLVLFRPYRNIVPALLKWVPHLSTEVSILDKRWDSVWDTYVEWKQNVIDIPASRYSPGPSTSRPLFDTDDYWACHISPRLRSMVSYMTRGRDTRAVVPSMIDGVPTHDSDADDASNANPNSRTHNGSDVSSDHGSPEALDGADQAVGKFPNMPSLPCGILPAGMTIAEDLIHPLNLGGRSAESAYARSFHDVVGACFRLSVAGTPVTAPNDEESDIYPLLVHRIRALAVTEAETNTSEFITKMDNFELDDEDEFFGVAQDNNSLENHGLRKWKANTHALLTTVKTTYSCTVVLEAAFYLLSEGILG